MSDNIPFEIQMEIIKWLPVKPLIQFRSVSKPWKSFIDSSDFIKGYGARHTQPNSHILTYKFYTSLNEAKFICLVDDDKNETFKVQKQELAPFVMSPLLKQYHVFEFVGVCHGLVFLYGFHRGCKERMVVIWNPSIGKSFGIADCSLVPPDYGFGVCPVTKDPTLVKIQHFFGKPWHAEVFTLSSGVWNVIPSGNLPGQSIQLNSSTQVVIDRFVYWAAYDSTCAFDKYMVVSFDLITKEFKVIHLPDSVRKELDGAHVRVSKLRESLVVYGSIYVDGARCCRVWVMEHDSSFRKLFIIGARVDKLLGFRESGEPIFETLKEEDERFNTLDVYDPCSQQINNLGIDGVSGTFGMGSYMESLLLLDQTDLHIYRKDN